MAKRAKIFLFPIGIVISLSIAGTFGDSIFKHPITMFGFTVLVFWLVAMFIDGLAQDIQDRKKR